MIVYALIDPRTDRIRYVGQTVRSARRRLRRHLSPCYLRGNTRKERWLRDLLACGLEPRIDVLQVCATPAALDVAERQHIRRLRQAGEDLTNLSPGGDGGAGPHTAEAKAKISAALKGRHRTAEHCRRIGEAQRGRRASDATRAKLSAARRGPRGPLTDAHRAALSVAKGGRPFVDQHGARYETQKGAARSLGLSVGHINAVLHGQRRSVGGYTFRFVSGEDLRVREFPA